jgi:protein O-mannosyl-transferase
VVNLSIHLAAGLVLFGLVSRTLVKWRLAARYEAVARPLAFSIAVLWLVHPLQTQSVTYIAQRFESLMGLFFLLTIYCFARAVDGKRAWLWYLASLVSCAAGMRVKEVMIVAPLLVMWYDRAFVSKTWRDMLQHKGYYAGLLVTTLLLMGPILRSVAAVVAPQLTSTTPIEHPNPPVQFETAAWVKGITPLDYLASQPGAILTYLRVAFYPPAQCFDYGVGVPTTASEIWLPALVILGLLAATVWSIWKYPAASFLGGWFFLILAPSSSIVPVKDLAVEHRMYLPLAAMLVVAVIAGYEFWQVALKQQSARQPASWTLKWLGPVVMTIAVVALGWQTWLRNIDYQSVLRLWQDTAGKAPQNARAHYSIAHELLEQGDLAHAVEAASRCVYFDPTYAEAYHVRGVAKAEQQDFAAAIENFSECVKQNPSYFKGYHDRGLAYQFQGDLDKAIADFDHLIKLAPVPRSYQARAAALAKRGDHRRAIDDLNQALQMNPASSETYRRRAESLYELGDYQAAWADVKLCRSFGGTVAPAFLELLDAGSPEPRD